MKGFAKRLGTLAAGIFLVSAMLVTASAAPTENCPGGCSHQAAIGTTHYDTLAEALSAAADGATVTVLKDISDAGAMTVSSAITLDLGGKTVTGQNGGSESLLSVSKDFTLSNGTLSTGAGTCLEAANCTVTIDKTATVQATNGAAALIVSGVNGQAAANISGKLTSQDSQPAVTACASGSGSCSLSIDRTAAISSTAANTVEVRGAGQLNITGGTITAKGNAILLDIVNDKTIGASITGGSFQVTNGETIVINKGTNATAPANFVTGGTFNKVPTAYVPAYCRTDDNGDGTYTVTAEYNISFGANGGSGTMSAVQADRGSTITLPRCTYTAPAGQHFKAWLVNGKEYAPGASLAINGDLTLTAVWANHSGGTATCTSKAVCTGCGAAYGSTGSHKLISSSGTPATCTAHGMNSHSRCSVCNQYFVSGVSVSASSLSIPALGHDMETVKGTEATCTEDGILDHEKCKLCGLLQAAGKDITDEQLVLPAAGHQQENVSAVASTCTTPGIAAHERCAQCGEVSVNGKTVDIQSLELETDSHVLSDWQSDAATHWKTCVECDEVFRQHSHKDEDGDSACDECGYAMPATQNMEATKEASGFSRLFLIPVIAAVVIAVGGVVIAVKKKKKQS